MPPRGEGFTRAKEIGMTLVKKSAHGWVRRELFGALDQRCGGRRQIGILTGRDGRIEHRSLRTDLSSRDPDRSHASDVGDHLAPQVAGRATARDDQLGNRDLNGVEALADDVRETFQRGPGDVCWSGSECDAAHDTVCIRIEERHALSCWRQIRPHADAAGAGL